MLLLRRPNTGLCTREGFVRVAVFHVTEAQDLSVSSRGTAPAPPRQRRKLRTWNRQPEIIRGACPALSCVYLSSSVPGPQREGLPPWPAQVFSSGHPAPGVAHPGADPGNPCLPPSSHCLPPHTCEPGVCPGSEGWRWGAAEWGPGSGCTCGGSGGRAARRLRRVLAASPPRAQGEALRTDGRAGPAWL